MIFLTITPICSKSQKGIKLNHSNYDNNKKLKSLCPQDHKCDKNQTKIVTRLENLTFEVEQKTLNIKKKLKTISPGKKEFISQILTNI